VANDSSQFESIFQNEIGLPKGMRSITYKLLWASSSALERGSKFTP